ncbi:MAG: serine protease [Thaumarchaeota archaeon]|nr:serine protease [Nitrososphaerota archaeon]
MPQVAAAPETRNKKFENQAWENTAFLYYQDEGSNEPHFTCTASVFATLKTNDYLLETASHCVSQVRPDPFSNDEDTLGKALGKSIKTSDIIFGLTKPGKFFVSFSGPHNPIFDEVTVFQNSDKEKDDVAVLELHTYLKLRPIPLGDERLDDRGSSIFNVGCPGGFAKLETWGTISLLKDDTGVADDPWPGAILADLRIAPGSSGSPVFDEQQHAIIGVVVAIFLTKGFPAISVIEPVSNLKRAIEEHYSIPVVPAVPALAGKAIL